MQLWQSETVMERCEQIHFNLLWAVVDRVAES